MTELTRQPFAERLVRTLGVVTAAYGAGTLVRPEVLSRPTGLDSSTSTDVLVRAIGVRDLASGLALVFAPSGRAQGLALVARIVADVGDAIAFGVADLSITGRRKAVSVAAAWAGLGVVALVARERTTP